MLQGCGFSAVLLTAIHSRVVVLSKVAGSIRDDLLQFMQAKEAALAV